MASDPEAWSFQDGAKALRELFKIFDDLTKRAGKVAGLYKTRQRKKVATDLAYLHFHEGGSLKHLKRIASGTFEDSDLDAIRKQMDETTDGVEETIRRLGQYEHVVREEVGFRSLISMERLINGQRGKRTIRESLHRLVHIGANNKDEAQARAEDLLLMVEEFNDGIVDLHDLVIKERLQKQKATDTAAKAIPAKRGTAKRGKNESKSAQ